MSTPPLAFAQMFEGLFLQGLKGQLTPALRARLKGLGVDLERLEPAYPAQVFVQCLEAAAAELYPQLPAEEAHRKLGQQFLAGFGQTLMGRAMMGMLRLLGPRRALQRMQRNIRTGNNYISTRYEERSAREVVLHYEGLYEPPGFMVGLLEHGGQVTGARNTVVQVEEHEGLRCRVRVSWDE